MNTDDFKARLADGGYASLTGAKKGIGRVANWSKREREEMTVLAEKHFAKEDKLAQPNTRRGAPAPKKAAAKREPAASAEPPKKRGRKPRAEAAAEPAQADSGLDFSHVRETVEVVKEILSVQTTAQTMGDDPAIIAANIRKANEALNACLSEVYARLDKVSIRDRMSTQTERLAQVVAATSPGPNGIAVQQ